MNKKRILFIPLSMLIALLLIYTFVATAAPQQIDPAAYLPFVPNDSNGEDTSTISGPNEFPVGLAVASPLEATRIDLSSPASATSTETWRTKYQADVLEIENVLSGTLNVSSVITPAGFLFGPLRAECYGPALDYTDHPDDPSPMTTTQQLPTGDLGIWNEYETVFGGGQDACAAAQLTKRMNNISNQGKNALLLSAGMYAVAASNGVTLPTSGGIITLTNEMNSAGIPLITFYTASIEYSPTVNTWIYNTVFEFDNVSRGITNTIVTHLEHTPGSSVGQFEGKLSYLINDMQDAFNCSGGPGPGAGPMSPTEVTLNGSLAYSRTSSTEIKLQSRVGTFCGHDNDGRLNGIVDTVGWTDNFAIFTAEYDPSTTAGTYAYAWQAGSMDAASRVLNTTISDTNPLSGEAYFGFGDRVQDDLDGSIMAKGMYCNWAGPIGSGGPGDSSRFQDYAQRQAVEFNASTGYFDSTDIDIHYAPTLNCLYDGSGTFWYDRNLNRVVDELSTDLVVTTATLDLLLPYDLDLDSTATITEAITQRGYSLPSPP